MLLTSSSRLRISWLLGRYSFISAGAVVTGDVPDYALVVGNPGKIIGWVDKVGKKLEFDDNGLSVCQKFKLKNNKVIEIE